MRSERELLLAARHRFALHGYEATSIRDIATDADVSPSLVLYHFRSKERLYRRVVEGLFRSLRKAEDLVLASTAHLDLADQLHAYAHARLHWCDDEPDGMRILARIWQSSAARAGIDLAGAYRERIDAEHSVLARYLAALPLASEREFFAASAALIHEAVFAGCEADLFPGMRGDQPDPARAGWRERAVARFVARLMDESYRGADARVAASAG